MRECVGAIIVRDGESVLLGKRSADRESYPNVWDVFGGHVEPGESHSPYVVTEWTGTPGNRQPQEHSEIRWFRIEETRHLELADRQYARLIEGVASRR